MTIRADGCVRFPHVAGSVFWALGAVPVLLAALGCELKYMLLPRKPLTLEASLSKGCPVF